MRIEKYTSEYKKIWDDFIDNSKMPMFMFKRDFVEYHADRFTDFSLMFYNDDDLIALLPASIYKAEIKSHGGLTYGGFIVNEKMKQHHMNDCFNALCLYLKQNNINKLLYKLIPYIYHTYPADEALYPLWKVAKLVRRDVSSTINLKNPFKMPKGRKAQVSRAKREGVIIEESNDFETFIDLENSVLKEYHNTVAVHSADELKLLQSYFPDNIKLYVAKYQNKIIAGAVIFIYPNVVHTQYMASNELSRQVGGLDLLISTLIDNFKNDKNYFDFGISTEDNGLLLNDGLCSQKEGFGGRSVAYDFYELNID